MNTKKFIVWSLLLAAIVVAVAAETSVDNKKGAKQVEIPTLDGKNDAEDSLSQGDLAVGNVRDTNYEVDQWRVGGWRGSGGPGWWGGGPGWRGGGRWGGPGWWGGGGPGWWGGGGPGWRGGGPGWWGGGW